MRKLQNTSIPGTACLVLLATLTVGCGAKQESASAAVKKMPAGSEFSGFLKDYTSLKPNAKLGADILTFVNAEDAKNLRRYTAIKVEPVEVYLASSADADAFQAKAGQALARYFERALKNAVGDAFTVVEEPGPLVLSLRAAIVGVDTSANAPDQSNADTEPLPHAAKIGNVRIEMELVDSETGERIAAAVDKSALGTDAEVGALRFERVDKYLAARQAFDGWAARVREFLDSEHELSAEDADKRKSPSYSPYGAAGSGN